ncbi:MAG: class I SAM-dependent methyltransferase [Candidatus Nealsonbacteria bacterium]
MQKITCPICHHLSTQELFRAKGYVETGERGPDIGEFGIRKCSDCGIVFTFPVLNWTEAEKFYPKIYLWKKEYQTKNVLIRLFRMIEEKYAQYILNYDTKRLLKFIGKNKKGDILDVGCGNGLRLELFKKVGFNRCCGIEPLKESAHYAKEVKNLSVIHQPLDKCSFAENSFDVVTLYNVFEHLNDPANHLKIVKNMLKPNGWLAIQIPNFDSWQAKLFKKNWAGLDPPRHCFQYTPKTINNLLSQNGFLVKTIDLKLNLWRPFFWGLSFSKISPQLIWQKEERGEQVIFCRIWWTALMLLSIIPTEIESIFGKGGHMTIYAQKR